MTRPDQTGCDLTLTRHDLTLDWQRYGSNYIRAVDRALLQVLHFPGDLSQCHQQPPLIPKHYFTYVYAF